MYNKTLLVIRFMPHYVVCIIHKSFIISHKTYFQRLLDLLVTARSYRKVTFYVKTHIHIAVRSDLSGHVFYLEISSLPYFGQGYRLRQPYQMGFCLPAFHTKALLAPTSRPKRNNLLRVKFLERYSLGYLLR